MGVLPDWMIERDVVVNPKPQPSPKGEISSGLSSYGLDMRVDYTFKVFTNINSVEVDPKAFNPQAFVDVDLTPVEHKWEPMASDHTQQYSCCKCRQTCYHPEEFMHGCLPKANFVRIPPNSFALGMSLETITIPRDCLGICVGKSTYARCGIIINVTPLEPEWTGKVTIEISNTSPLPARVYAGEGIMQVIFLRTDGHAEAVMNAVRRLCADNTNNILAWGHDGVDQGKVSKYVEEMLHMELPRGTCRTSYANKSGRYQGQTEITLPFVEK